MSLDPNEVHYELIIILGKYEVLFTNSRIKRDSVPTWLYVYDIRHYDECHFFKIEI